MREWVALTTGFTVAAILFLPEMSLLASLGLALLIGFISGLIVAIVRDVVNHYRPTSGGKEGT